MKVEVKIKENGKAISIIIPDRVELRFKVVLKIKYTSARKMMSVVIEDKHGNLELICKGADDALIPKIESS